MYKELKDYFPDAITGDGIFSAISQISWFPGVGPSQLDTYFMLMHGEKLGSQMLDQFTDENGEVIPCITVVEKPAEFKIAK